MSHKVEIKYVFDGFKEIQELEHHKTINGSWLTNLLMEISHLEMLMKNDHDLPESIENSIQEIIDYKNTLP